MVHWRPPTHLLLLLVFASIFNLSSSQTINDTNCNGILLTYTLNGRTAIRPNVTNPADQPYSFTATATVLNSGTTPLISWALLITFASREIIVSADGSVLSDGSDFPFNTSTSTSPTSFSGFPNTDLNTPIATAGDPNKIQAIIPIIGTLFAQPPPFLPLPTALALDDQSFSCPPIVPGGHAANTSILTCCVPNPNFLPNSTIPNSINGTISPRRTGDLTFDYDITQASAGSYLALVSISNNNPLGRLDNWHLSFDWSRGEFIYEIKGAYTTVKGPGECILGPQGQYYQSFDFTNVANCQRRPTILDLPATMATDSVSGGIPSCCRNGTLLPPQMEESQSKSAFQMQVFKMPPDLNRTQISPPINWRITGGALNPNYVCRPPARVSPSLFPDPSGLQSDSVAIASWQVVCTITKPKKAIPKCCVSFSGFYNKSVVPCKTCACGCVRTSHSCNASAPALLLPSQAVLVPFDNRTGMTLEWARQKHFTVPTPMPCGDFCGVSINWHVDSDYTSGWTSRITLFNWGEVTFPDWFVAVEMEKAYNGFEAAYSFNGTAIGNSTIFMEGLQGLNYLMGEVDGAKPWKDPRVPGKQQSVLSFTKKETPDINVVGGDGFPTKVFFNGEECSLPDMIPSDGRSRSGAAGVSTLVVILVVIALLL